MNNFIFFEPRGNQTAQGEILISLNKAGADNYSIVFRLTKSILDTARWKQGYRVLVGVSNDGKYGLLKRVKSGGYKLTAQNNHANHTNCAFSMRATPELTAAFFGKRTEGYVPDAIEVRDEGILFLIPQA